MYDDTIIEPYLVDSSSRGSLTIGKGAHARVSLYPDSMIIQKKFTDGDHRRAKAQAQREHVRLERFSRRLARLEHVNCPEPVCLDLNDVAVWMTFCPGKRLDLLLEREPLSIAAHIDHIAQLTAVALGEYVLEFDEPYYDLTPSNMLYDMSSRTLSLIDFMIPDVFEVCEYEQSPLDISLGSFLAYSIFPSVHPRKVSNRDYWAAQKQLSMSLLRTLSSSHSLRPDLIRRVSTDGFEFTGRIGRPVRRLWYRTAGRRLFDRRIDSILTSVQPAHEVV